MHNLREQATAVYSTNKLNVMTRLKITIIFHVQDMDFNYYREHNNDWKLNLYARMKYYKKRIIRKA